MNDEYPNLMCFGNEPYKYDSHDSCNEYEKCKEEYYKRWYSFMEKPDNDE